MMLFKSWKEGLSALKLDNLKQFLLVTFKNVGDLYKVAWLYWVIFFGISVALFGISASALFVQIFKMFSLIILPSMFTFILCLYVRPSVKKKNYRKLIGSFPYFLRIAVVFLLLWAVVGVLGFSVALVGPFFGTSVANALVLFGNSIYFNLLNILFLFVVPSYWLVIVSLFALDGKKVVSTAKNTLIFTVQNYPLLLIVGMLLFAIHSGLWYLFKIIPFEGRVFEHGCHWVRIFLLEPFVVALFANIYIKQVYGRDELYR